MTKPLPDIEGIANLDVLYLTTIGRRTGSRREVEIWFVADGERLYVLAEHFHKTQWVKNIDRNPRVRIRLRDREFPATARILDQEADRDTWRLAQDLARGKYGWGDGLPVEIVLNDPDRLPPYRLKQSLG